jgi:tRNA (Thr-GGU) A37 N-methylase
LKVTATFEVKPIGRVESLLTDVAAAPRQPDEGAPEAWLVEALDGTPIIDVKGVLSEDISLR